MSHVQDTLIDAMFDGRYRIKRRLGAGGMANVYLAEDTELGRRVAIKILNDRYANDDLFVERFRREAKSAAALSHPNIVSIYDRGEAEGTYYIAMEVVEGASLKELIRKSGRLAPAVSISYAHQILSALRTAHRNGIIHRDIKPHNILVGPEQRLKVTDFGIARAGTTQMTEVGSIMGTAQYLSPEQARGGEVTPASDLYSLGVVMYEMLTGDVPFTGDTHVEIAMKHVQDPPVPPSRKAPGIPAELDQVVLRALAKNPADRYQTADAFAEDLTRVEAGLPVATETAEAATHVLRGSSSAHTQVLERPRQPTQPPAGQPPSRGGRRPPYDPYERPRRKRSILPWLIAAILVVALAGGGYYVYTQVHDRLIKETPIPVPNVQGIQEQLARQKLDTAGFAVKVQRHADDQVKAGFVINQSPEAGTRIQKGDPVTIVVSTGLEQVQVPRVVGLDQAAAVQALDAAGLKLGQVKQVFSTKVPAGTVISQDPKPGEQVGKGSTVDLRVSRGEQLLGVPNVVGQDEATAKQTLADAGFKVESSTANSDKAQGTVIDQQPNGGQAAKGSTVAITVSAGPQLVQVPSVLDLDEATAISTLEGQGFNVLTKDLQVLDQGQDGFVQNQDPTGGSQVDPGSTVTIYVGRFTSTGSTTTTTSG